MEYLLIKLLNKRIKFATHHSRTIIIANLLWVGDGVVFIVNDDIITMIVHFFPSRRIFLPFLIETYLIMIELKPIETVEL